MTTDELLALTHGEYTVTKTAAPLWEILTSLVDDPLDLLL